LPSDYASYQIETGQFKQAIETLERGRALLWSEMRGLRTSTNQLRAANPTLADKLADINRRLESMTMSVAQNESEKIAVTGHGEGMDSIGRLVTTQRHVILPRLTDLSSSSTNPDGARTSSFSTKIHPLPSSSPLPTSTIARTG
jgi:hypothetical protein